MRVFFNAIVIQILLTAYVFLRGWKILPEKKLIKGIYILIFGAELLAYFAGFFGSSYFTYQIEHYLAWMGTSWMIFIIFLACFFLIYDLFRLIEKKTNRKLRIVDLNKRKTKAIYYLVSLSIALGVMIYGNYNFRHPKVKELNLTVNKQAGELQELKVVLASDMHAGYLINKSIVSKYTDLIMAQKPDLILIVGDIIDYDLQSVKDQNIQEEFGRLKAPYGVFASTGNHDYIKLKSEEQEEKITWLSNESGLTLLRDTAIFINNSFYVVGREDDKFLMRKSLKQIMKNVDKNFPIIVINHEPHKLQEEVDAGADLALYGHTHNGQVFPANILLKFMYEVAYGYKQKENTHVYVTSGIGLAGPQYRIGTDSEIVVINIKFKN